MADRRHVAGVSWPRSGHHLLERLLRDTLAPDFRYCDPYSPRPCCKQIPCAWDTPPDFSKNHDFHLSLPQVPGQAYLVQVRDFVPSVVSNFELFLQAHPDRDTGRHFRAFAANQFTAYRGFCDKWVTSAFAADQMVLRYDDLVADPRGALTRIVPYLRPGAVPDAGRIDAAVARVAANRLHRGSRVEGPQGVHAARDPRLFRHWDPTLFATLAALRRTRSQVAARARALNVAPPPHDRLLDAMAAPEDALDDLLRR